MKPPVTPAATADPLLAPVPESPPPVPFAATTPPPPPLPPPLAVGAVRRQALQGPHVQGSELKSLNVQGVSFMWKVYNRGLHDVMLSTTWVTLCLLIVTYYVLVGAALGALLSVAGPADENSDHEDGEADNAIASWWTRGVLLLLMNVSFEPEGPWRMAVVCIAAISSSIVMLGFFGVIAEKLSARRNLMRFSRVAILRRAPVDGVGVFTGGTPMLTMRFANITGESHVSPEMTMSVLIRILLPDDDGLIVQLPLKCNYKGCVGLLAAGFIHHVIDEQSPLYCPPTEANPTGCSFKNVRGLASGVKAVALQSQTLVAGMSGFLNLENVLIDHSFVDSIGIFGRGGFDVSVFDDTVPQNLPPEARLQPHRVAMGLPPRPGLKDWGRSVQLSRSSFGTKSKKRLPAPNSG